MEKYKMVIHTPLWEAEHHKVTVLVSFGVLLLARNIATN